MARASEDRRKAAAERAKRKARENQSRNAGKSYLTTDIKRLEVKDGQRTLLTVIPYVVREKRHPEDIKPGELWYKRPFRIHRNIGVGDDRKSLPCPRTFHPRASCVVCDAVDDLWNSFRNTKDPDKKKEIKEEAQSIQARNRELFLVYDHDSKELRLLDEAYGGGNLAGFGMLLDSRLASPLQEEWACFYLDGDDGMALSVLWNTSKSGDLEWTRPVSIDFIPRKNAPVPKDIWKKAVELSEILHHTTSKEIEQAYLELPPEDEEEKDEPEDEPEEEGEDEPEEKEDKSKTKSRSKTPSSNSKSKPAPKRSKKPEPPPEPEPEEEGEDELDDMDKEELLAYAKKEELFEVRELRLLSRKSEDEIRQAIIEAESGGEKEDSENECPYGHKFGEDFNEMEECKDCSEEQFNSCADKKDAMEADLP